MNGQNLDNYLPRPTGMNAYLSHYGWHFNRKMCEWAVSMMRKKNPNTKEEERITPYKKEDVDDLMKRYNVNVKNLDNSLYDYVYVANMCKADYLKSSVPDEQHLAMYVMDTIDDVDAADGSVFRKWYACMRGKGVSIEWEDML